MSASKYNLHRSSHGACEDYYADDTALSSLVLRADAEVFRAFPEYARVGCPSPGSRHLLRSLLGGTF